MAEFEPITTQEEFDTRIAARLKREREKAREEFSDYDKNKTDLAAALADLDNERGKNAGFESTIAELRGKVQQYETDSAKTRIAAELGLDPRLCSRLSGNTEEEIKASAEELVSIVGGRVAAPHFNPGNNKEEDKTGLKALAKNLFKDAAEI